MHSTWSCMNSGCVAISKWLQVLGTVFFFSPCTRRPCFSLFLTRSHNKHVHHLIPLLPFFCSWLFLIWPDFCEFTRASFNITSPFLWSNLFPVEWGRQKRRKRKKEKTYWHIILVQCTATDWHKQVDSVHTRVNPASSMNILMLEQTSKHMEFFSSLASQSPQCWKRQCQPVSRYSWT